MQRILCQQTEILHINIYYYTVQNSRKIKTAQIPLTDGQSGKCGKQSGNILSHKEK